MARAGADTTLPGPGCLHESASPGLDHQVFSSRGILGDNPWPYHDVSSTTDTPSESHVSAGLGGDDSDGDVIPSPLPQSRRRPSHMWPRPGLNRETILPQSPSDELLYSPPAEAAGDVYGRPQGAESGVEDECAGAGIVDEDRHHTLGVACLVVRVLEAEEVAQGKGGHDLAGRREGKGVRARCSSDGSICGRGEEGAGESRPAVENRLRWPTFRAKYETLDQEEMDREMILGARNRELGKEMGLRTASSCTAMNVFISSESRT